MGNRWARVFLFTLLGLMSDAVFANEGALIHVKMTSTVGISLKEFPDSVKPRVQKTYLKRPSEFWKARARRQVQATLYRLIYRQAYYGNEKGRLPLPPENLWRIEVGPPKVVKIDGHDLVAVQYSFESVLLTSAASVVEAEPALTSIGGQWSEPFTLPADPEHLLERTGFACLDEADYPPRSVDSENALHFFDQSCLAGKNICHQTTPYPQESCDEALKYHVGRVQTSIQFTRRPWDVKLADLFRTDLNPAEFADLEVLEEALTRNRIIYRYFPGDSCALTEGCVKAPGWRRLLQFDASVANRGRKPLHLGKVSPESLLVRQNMFEFSPCHQHFHFSHYGRFSLTDGSKDVNSKKSFCLESTSRVANNESTPLTHPYSCRNQGIEAGWGDDYIAGIECQWIDVTEIKQPTTRLSFQINPDQFLCEGEPILDFNNDFTFVPTEFKSANGDIQNRIACQFSPRWNKNNFQSRVVLLPKTGSYVTEPCLRGQGSVLKNCGFQEEKILRNCEPGKNIRMKCATQAPAVVRVCEASHKLKTGVACTYRDSLQQTVMIANQEFEFKCPTPRDPIEAGGLFSLYFSNVVSEDPVSVNCEIQL